MALHYNNITTLTKWLVHINIFKSIILIVKNVQQFVKPFLHNRKQ
jgi:hypothetical protein